jgi:hypothetical protein
MAMRAMEPRTMSRLRIPERGWQINRLPLRVCFNSP